MLLTANVQYYIVVFSGSSDVPAFGANEVQIQIARGGQYLDTPANDVCANAIAVTLNSTTALPTNTYWTNDYTISVDCYRDTSINALGNGGRCQILIVTRVKSRSLMILNF